LLLSIAFPQSGHDAFFGAFLDSWAGTVDCVKELSGLLVRAGTTNRLPHFLHMLFLPTCISLMA
jgi:hypothetical protein